MCGSSRPEGLRCRQEQVGEHFDEHVAVAGLSVHTVASQNLACQGRELLEEHGVAQQVVTKLLQNLRARSATGEPERITPPRSGVPGGTPPNVDVDGRVKRLLLKLGAPRRRHPGG